MYSTRLTQPLFSDLLPELMDKIGGFLDDDLVDLCSLSRVNHRFYTIFTRLLYKAAIATHHPGPTIKAASTGNLPALKLATQYGADLDYIQGMPLTADEITTMGIRYKLSPHARWGAPLHFAIIYGHQDAFEWLLSKGVNIEAPGRLYCGCEPFDPINTIKARRHKFGSARDDSRTMVWTPLHYAICHRKTSMAHNLLSAGASPRCEVDITPNRLSPGLAPINDVYSHCETKLIHQIRGSRRHLTRWAIFQDANHKPEVTEALETAVSSGEVTIVERLVRETGINATTGNRSILKDGMGFQHAAHTAEDSMVRLFLSLGADTSALQSGQWDVKLQPVCIAFETHNPRTAIALLEIGSPVWTDGSDTLFFCDELKDVAVLSQALESWNHGKQCHHSEETKAKRKAFLMLAERTVTEVPESVTTECLSRMLQGGLSDMHKDSDFKEEDFAAYADITGLGKTVEIK
ncbi:hypothetical protein CGCTS75_v004622 [Colletotrichum tropicale]|nr:hypothetical protein CGCTS75_v004622 [Colletotrichum tropicale]